MTDPMKNAWDDVGESFSALGRAMKERYAAGPTPEEEAAAEAEGTSRAGDPTAPIREALEHLLAAGKEFGDRAAALVRDDEVKAQAKHVATSLSGAIEATVDQIGREVRGFVKGARHRDAVETDEHAELTEDITDAEPPTTTGQG